MATRVRTMKLIELELDWQTTLSSQYQNFGDRATRALEAIVYRNTEVKLREFMLVILPRNTDDYR